MGKLVRRLRGGYEDRRDAILGLYLRKAADQLQLWQIALQEERDKGHVDDALENMERQAAAHAAEIDRQFQAIAERRKHRREERARWKANGVKPVRKSGGEGGDE